MPLVTSEKMLLDAKKDGYAVGAFNVENMEMVKAVIAAAEELNAPVMLQTTPSTVKYGTLETFAGIVKAEAAKTKIPVNLRFKKTLIIDILLSLYVQVKEEMSNFVYSYQ